MLDWTKKHYVGVSMKRYQEDMCEEFPEEIKPNIKAPWNDTLFKIDNNSLLSSKHHSEMFHALITKCMLLVKRSRPDLEP